MNYILVGIGGFFGSVLRYEIGRLIAKKSKSTFPVGTFMINLTGAFFLGFLCKYQISPKLNLFLCEGFLGAFTTFSTFMYEGFNLFKDKKMLNAIFYIFISIFLGVLGFYLGIST